MERSVETSRTMFLTHVYFIVPLEKTLDLVSFHRIAFARFTCFRFNLSSFKAISLLNRVRRITLYTERGETEWKAIH